MPEILTESFCERCGTRYTFEAARPKIRLKGVKVLSRGLKNFVLSDDTTMDEAMASARSEADREVTAHQLDAFHKTFSFCMSCRQYTCPNCWNEVEARCLTCAPLALPEVAETALPGFATLAEASLVAGPATNGANGHVPEAMNVSLPDTIAGLTSEPATKAAGQTSGLLRRFRPGQSLDDELAAFERERSDTDAAVVAAGAEEAPASLGADQAIEAGEAQAGIAAEAVEAAAAAPTDVLAEESLAAAAWEPAAAVEPLGAAEPEAAPESIGAAQPEPELKVGPAADIVEQPTWRITAPDLEAADGIAPARPDDAAPLQANGAPAPSAEPQWPASPEWPARQAPQASVGLPFLSRPVQPEGGVDALWAASNQELVATPPAPGRSSSGIQPCISCGLSLSANARFCRRCGTLQGG